MLEMVLCYGCKVWCLTAEMNIASGRNGLLEKEQKLQEETEFAMKKSDSACMQNDTVIKRIEKIELIWFSSHLKTMPENRWPKQNFQCPSPPDRKEENKKTSWNEESFTERIWLKIERLGAGWWECSDVCILIEQMFC